MNQQHHQHDHGHKGHHQHSSSKGVHKDWRAWAVVILMLFAMAIYVITRDESIIPGGPEDAPMPAADAPAGDAGL